MVIAADEGSSSVASLLASELEAATGWHVKRGGPGDKGLAGTVRLSVQGSGDNRARGPTFPGPDGEHYRLSVSEEGIDITARAPAGIFYGTRTLLQLLPPDLLRSAPVRKWASVPVEGVEVEDGPRFGWRGIGLDVARHFFPKELILKLVRLASLHKLNVLHLHLSDDQGWRVQVDSYPRLTELGAWRRESPAGHYSEGRKDGTPHGGFYTKADLSEIVAYAAKHHVTVLPEVDMPGHMQAAIAAYPELGSTGRQLEVGTDWGISQHVLNLGPATLRFCRQVLEEVMDIFPGQYVHIGGDECPTTQWEASSSARDLSAQLGLSGVHQLQGWFTAEMSKVLAERGRRLVGWDEVFSAGAPPGSVIVAWEHDRAWSVATQAALAGHDVVLAPEPWCYFDWAYSDDPREPLAIRPAISVRKVYSLEPVPKELAEELAHHVIGTQCQLWTEYVSTPWHAEYMYFPRACALAEVAWAGQGGDWEDFERRLQAHTARLDAIGVNYRPLAGPRPGQCRTWAPPWS
jgi:hexosaminidase